jgi:hypothetical protein
MQRLTFSILGMLSLALLTAGTASSREYTTRVIARDLNQPTGIATRGHSVYFTEVPTPGTAGGANAVKELHLGTGDVRVLHQGEPDPVNIAVDGSGVLYWTCRTAGVILEDTPSPKTAAVALLSALDRPTGIAADRHGNVYFTEVPTPGTPGPMGGTNRVSMVSVSDTGSITVLSMGEPEPVDIASSGEGELYWTCKSAGVILTRSLDGTVSLLLSGLNKPVGIALDEQRNLLYWTEVPTPGVAGPMGGMNKVWVYDLSTGEQTLVNAGDPEPTDITVGNNGRVFWTCTSAGVIVEARAE